MMRLILWTVDALNSLFCRPPSFPHVRVPFLGHAWMPFPLSTRGAAADEASCPLGSDVPADTPPPPSLPLHDSQQWRGAASHQHARRFHTVVRNAADLAHHKLPAGAVGQGAVRVRWPVLKPATGWQRTPCAGADRQRRTSAG